MRCPCRVHLAAGCTRGSATAKCGGPCFVLIFDCVAAADALLEDPNPQPEFFRV